MKRAIPAAIELAAMELLETAMEQPKASREEFIKNYLDAPDEVCQRALQLLTADHHSSAALRTGGAADHEYDEVLPKQIGAYRILRLLGRGGMGAVFLGERASDDFEHVVAIKVIKQALISESLIGRFRRERQILAQLNHPHIAHFYDGGETENGSPYIVMEYVDGIPVTTWIKQQNPDFDRRLRLFLQICDAVEFAHQHLVIHRDLTPSNVLVAEGDQAKLIDFGISRPQTAQGEDSAASTFSGLSLTPGFAAPERMAGVEANTLIDIFSLGSLLKALLGDEMPAELTAISEKAQEPDPAERYPTVSALKEAVIDWQEQRPVAAYSSSAWYRFRKFVRRERIIVGATAAISLALLGGIGGIGWAYNQAENARAEAEQRFRETRSIANIMMFEVYDTVNAVPGSTSARRLLAETAQKYLDTLAADPNAPDAVKLEAGLGYMRLADVIGGTGGGTLGLRDEALRNYGRSDEILTALHRANPASEANALALAELRFKRSGTMVHITEDYEAGIVFAQSIGKILDRDCADKDQCTLGRAKAFLAEGENFMWLEQPDTALANFDRALDAFRELGPAIRKTEDAIRTEAQVYRQKSKNYHFMDDKEKTVEQADIARKLLEGAIARGIASVAMERDLAGVEFMRGGTLDELGRTKEAIPALDTSYAIMQRLVAHDAQDLGSLRLLAIAGGQRALTLASAGRFGEAIENGRAMLAIRQQLSTDHPDQSGYFRDVAIQYKDLGDIYKRSGQQTEACRYFKLSVVQFEALDSRWEMSDFDRNRPYAYAQHASKNC
ncbi:serine/threonine protein kinase [Parasphingorhabdus halotolerans]|uniref:Protein kinase n=1 Tax=Parasphingorhabdus halotolerans TaxID=2725558 RepID=A0A6H2DR18_9SPHN|nr:protein kinase [Parasphingorhabdus halotolerans]QJB70395.1 protein kinase [Parasphingorhabdus halotolerans]